MAHIKDVAMTMVNESIELAKQEGERYYLGITKLHNLLYLSQCYMLSFHKRKLFDSRVGAYVGGAYVDGITSFIIAEKGVEPITSEFEKNKIYPITPRRLEAIRVILTTFSKLDVVELNNLVLSTLPLQNFRDELIRHFGMTAATMTTEDFMYDVLRKVFQGEKWFNFATEATITIEETHMSQMKDFFLQFGCNEPEI